MEEENNLNTEISKAEEVIKQRIFIIRGQRVMIDFDIANLYQVETRNLVQAVNRNINKFPEDFMFKLTKEEYESLRSQIGISNSGRGGRRYLPYAFTEHGVVMLSSVLNSEIAILMNIFIIRAFIKMRESLDNYRDLAIKIGEIEMNQTKDHEVLRELYSEVRHFFDKSIEPKEKIGFRIDE